MPIYKTYNVTSGAFISETLPGGRLFNTYGSESWFTPVINPYFSNLIGYTITAPAIGSYSIQFTELVNGEVVTWTIILNVLVDRYNVFQNCCGDRNIAWLNIQGGWQNYIFTGIKTFNIDAGRDKQYKTSDYVLRHSEISGVYDGELLTTGDIPKSHADLLDGLKAKSIQAYLFNDDSGTWDIPILIDRDSYVKYKSRDKFFEVRVKFIYATEILIQSQ